MKSRFLLTTLAAIGLFIVDGRSAQAAEKTWNAGGGTPSWNTAGNWNPSGVPGTNDYVTIPACGSGRTVGTCPTIDTDVTAANSSKDIVGLRIQKDASLTTGAYNVEVTSTRGLFIEGGAVLDVSASGTVKCQGGGSSGEYVVDGVINLGTSTSKLRFESASEHRLAGAGAIRGSDNNAKIEIPVGVTLRSSLLIDGALRIDRSGEGTDPLFYNEGLVHANRGSTPFVIALGDLEVRGHGEFRMSGGSTAEINVESTCTATKLDADFALYGDSNVLDIDADVLTAGRLYFGDGEIQVATNMAFIAK